jgi:hypothetical protein
MRNDNLINESIFENIDLGVIVEEKTRELIKGLREARAEIQRLRLALAPTCVLGMASITLPFEFSNILFSPPPCTLNYRGSCLTIVDTECRAQTNA